MDSTEYDAGRRHDGFGGVAVILLVTASALLGYWWRTGGSEPSRRVDQPVPRVVVSGGVFGR